MKYIMIKSCYVIAEILGLYISKKHFIQLFDHWFIRSFIHSKKYFLLIFFSFKKIFTECQLLAGHWSRCYGDSRGKTRQTLPSRHTHAGGATFRGHSLGIYAGRAPAQGWGHGQAPVGSGWG